MFRVKNNTFIKRLRTAIQKDKTTQAILKKISQGDIEEFTKKERFLLFQEKIYIPTSLREEIITEQHKLPIHGHQLLLSTHKKVSKGISTKVYMLIN